LSPTQRSLKLLRDEGYVCWIVEQTIRVPGKTWKRDLFNGFDVLCVKGNETLAVQTTTLSNLGSRLEKLANNEFVPKLREAGWKLVAHGWRKLKSGWACKTVDVS
jgi:hypothetical protein